MARARAVAGIYDHAGWAVVVCVANGEVLDRAWVTHEELTAGGTLEFHMGPEPNREWGSAVESRPPSLLVR